MKISSTSRQSLMKNSAIRLCGQIAAIAASVSCSGFAMAEISGAQAEALGDHSMMQVREFVVTTLSACASAYPDTHGDAVNAMEILVPKLKAKPEFADKWIQSVGQCMNREQSLTRTQCSTIESKIRYDGISLDDKELAPIFDKAAGMLEPCRRKEN